MDIAALTAHLNDFKIVFLQKHYKKTVIFQCAQKIKKSCFLSHAAARSFLLIPDMIRERIRPSIIQRETIPAVHAKAASPESPSNRENMPVKTEEPMHPAIWKPMQRITTP